MGCSTTEHGYRLTFLDLESRRTILFMEGKRMRRSAARARSALCFLHMQEAGSLKAAHLVVHEHVQTLCKFIKVDMLMNKKKT